MEQEETSNVLAAHVTASSRVRGHGPSRVLLSSNRTLLHSRMSRRKDAKFKWFGKAVGGVVSAATDFISDAAEVIAETGGAVVETVVDGVTTVGEFVVDGVEFLYNGTVEMVASVSQWIVEHGGNAMALAREKLRAIWQGIMSIPTAVKEAISAAMQSAREHLIAFRANMLTWANMTAEALDAVKDTVVNAAKNLVEGVGGIIQGFAMWYNDTVAANWDGVLGVVGGVLKWLAEFAIHLVYGNLQECIADKCTSHGSLLFAFMLERLFDPITALNETIDPANEEGASEAKAFYELACGFGNVSMYDNIVGADVFRFAAEGYNSFDDFQYNFQALDTCIMDNCADSFGDIAWAFLQNGLPAHCNELIEMPARYHAGEYNLKWRYSANSETGEAAGEWNDAEWKIRLDCQGFMFSQFGVDAQELFNQRVQWLDVSEVCHNMSDAPGIENSTFYIANVYNITGHYEAIECLRFTGEGTFEGYHFGVDTEPGQVEKEVLVDVRYEMESRNEECPSVGS